MSEIKTLEELNEIEARAASGCSVVGCWEELDDWYIACKEDVPALCAALREAWADTATTTEALKLEAERVRVLKDAVATLWRTIDENDEGGEIMGALSELPNEFRLAWAIGYKCAAKQEANT
jgi:hypothetical protein